MSSSPERRLAMPWPQQQHQQPQRHSSSESIPRRPVPATKKSERGTPAHAAEPMDTHGIDLSSLNGSAHYNAGGADPVIQGRDSPDHHHPHRHNHHLHTIAGRADDDVHHKNHGQRQDLHAALLQNAQEPACDDYFTKPSPPPPPPAPPQQQQQQQQYHQLKNQSPSQPPPYPHPYPYDAVSNYHGGPPPNATSNIINRSFRTQSHNRCASCTSVWHSSWNMYLWLVLGVGFAIGHHGFYSTLDGKPAVDQVRMLRYGTILAFAAKASLGAAVISAFQQRLWATVRSKILSVAALDSMFAATENLIAFLNWEFLKGAKATAALALFVWISPLVVILTANTLLVQSEVTVQNTTCPGVRSLNFAMEETADWRRPLKIDGLYEMPLSFWNTTKPPNQDPPPAGWFDYYTAPSPNFQQTATLGAFFQEVISRKNASIEVCSKGWNCTFEIEFKAPGYKCQELAGGVGSTPANLTQQSGEAQPPFGTDLLLPKGTFAYYAFATGGEYSTTQMRDVDIGGIPKTKPPYPEHMGAFRTEPVIWIGHVVSASAGAAAGGGGNDAFAAQTQVGGKPSVVVDVVLPKIFACEHYETQYTAVFNYTDTTQSAYMKKRSFLHPIINTTYIPGVDADDGTADNVTATPTENYVLPKDVARYRRTAAYHSLGFMLRKFLNGTVQTDKQLVNPVTNTDAIQTKLLDPRNNYFPHENLMDLVQDFYEDLILSIFSFPQFLPVVWAAAPNETTGQLVQGGGGSNSNYNKSTAASYEYPCQRSRMANLYSYHARDLWIVYAIAIFLAMSCVAAGALAIQENGGVLRNTRFSSIVAATRGPALEKVRWEGPDWDRGDVPKDVKELKIGYGIMNQNPATSFDTRYLRDSPTWSPNEVRCGFGLEGDVNQNKREGSLFHR